MNASSQLESIFFAALEKQSPAERKAFLDEACTDDAELRGRVERMLSAQVEAGNFLEQPAIASDATLIQDRPIPEQPGSTIGRYKLLEEIGEGGFGVVFMADQEHPVRRRVALKIIKPGMDTRQVIARFEAERQALAMMDHPNIAKVLDAGATDTGRPYFVMELVKGTPITSYVDEARLGTIDRLKLFISVCSAVQHAHQKGIIHRDLKPSNVLVTMHDDKPVPKIIDFGIAKATQARLTEKTLFTEFRQLIGTPAYMSPEQAQMSGLDIDTRSDIYSLGVLLYELLTGTTPFDSNDLLRSGYDEMRRIIREVESPLPSARLSTLAVDAQLTRATERNTDPRCLCQLLLGDLDWIVMKCLEKDRTRRYETANAVAADIERHLADQPIEARRPTPAYRVKKFVRRNKVGVLAGSAVVAFLMTAVVTLVLSNTRIRRASSAKDAALETAQAAIDQMLVRVADEMIQDAPMTDTLRQDLFQDALRFYEGMLGQTESNRAIHAAIARVLDMMADVQLALGLHKEAATTCERYIELLDRFVAESPHDPRFRMQRAYAEEHFAYVLQVGTSDEHANEVEKHYRKAIDLFTSLEKQWPDHAQPMMLPLRYLSEQATKRGDPKEAKRYLREAIERGERYLARETPAVSSPTPVLSDSRSTNRRRYTMNRELRTQLCWSCVYLADVLIGEQEFKEAESVLQTGQRQVQQILERDPTSVQVRDAASSLQHRLAAVYCATGRVTQAAPLFNQAISEMQALCATFPMNRQYWVTLRYLQEDAVRNLQQGSRIDDAKICVAKMRDWLRKTVPRIPVNSASQNELLIYELQLASLLKATAQEKDATEVEQMAVQLSSQLDPDAINSPECMLALAQIRLTAAFERVFEASGHSEHGADARLNLREEAERFNELAGELTDSERLRPLLAAYVTIANRLATDSDRGSEIREVERYFSALTHKLVLANPQLPEPRMTVAHAMREFAAVGRNGAYLSIAEEMVNAAFSVFQEVCTTFPDNLTARHYLALTHQSLGFTLGRRGDLDGSEKHFRQAVQILDEHAISFDAKPINDCDRAQCYHSLAAYLARTGQSTEAPIPFQKGCAILDRHLRLQPTDAVAHNDLAWILANFPIVELRKPSRAVELATRAVELQPRESNIWNTLGAANYRAGHYDKSIDALNKAMQLQDGGDAVDWIFLAMAHRQLQHQEEAHMWYDKFVEWMDKYQVRFGALVDFRAEAAGLLDIAEPELSTEAAPQP